jgi:hypothetical protein
VSVTFGSPAWLMRVRAELVSLVARHGEPGHAFTFCEVWTDAPAGAVGDTGDRRAAWHARIDGTTCLVDAGELDNADLKLVMDYESVLPFARRLTADTSDRVPIAEVHGDGRRLPAYFKELHDALAVVTA